MTAVGLGSIPSQGTKILQAMLLLLLSRFSRVRLLATPWTAAYQAPLPMGFSRQEYWSGVPSPSPASREAWPKNQKRTQPVTNLVPHLLEATSVISNLPLPPRPLISVSKMELEVDVQVRKPSCW